MIADQPSHVRPGTIATWYVAVGLLTVIVLLFRLPDPDGAIIFERLDFAPLDRMIDPSSAPSWQQVALPDNWRSFSSRPSDQGVYRGVFQTPGIPTTPWAIHIPTFSSRMQLYVNGTLIGENLPYGAAPPLDQPLPLFLRIPHPVLKVGDNELEIQLTSGGMKGGFLDRVMVGAQNRLQPYHSLRWFTVTTVPQFLIVWEVILATGMFALWYARPKEQAYGLFCGILAWAILNGLPLILVDLPLPKGVWGRIAYLADIWQAFLAVLFAYHFLGRSPPIPLRWHLALPIAVTLAAIFVSEPIFKLIVLVIILPFGLTALLWCAAVFAMGAFRDNHIGAHLITATLITVVTFTTHDVLIIYNIIDTHITYLLRYSLLLVITCVSGILLQRFIGSLNAVDDLTCSFDARLLEKEDELRTSFSARRADERRRDLEDERVRLMRDMHDGLGGQLVSIVSMAEREQQPESLAAAARAALDDLRMIVASLDIDEGDLSSLLGMFRERIERQLAVADLDLDWQMTELPDIGGLNPSSALHILRILQEAVTNVIKHAGATKVRISVQACPDATGGVQIDIVDDGRGGVCERRECHGIANMIERAKAIGAELIIESSPKGARLRLALPRRLPDGQDVTEVDAAHPLSMGYR